MATRDVLNFASVDSFPAESTCVSFGRHSVKCAVVVAQHSVYCARVGPAHQLPVFRSLVVASTHLVHETVCS